MKNAIIFYSLSTAINKGSILLFFPLLTQFLTLEDFGKWSLVIVVSNLLIPIISLNGSAGILREGSSNLKIGFFLFKKYIYISGVICTAICLFIFYYGSDNWIYYSILISCAEGILILSLTYIRTEEKASLYFLISLFKTIALLIMILYVKHHSLSLNTLLLYHFLVVTIFALSITLFLLIRYKDNILQVKFIPMFVFSIMLIPHSLSQWIMSSSDRIILEYMLGSINVGIYSLAYNMALILMLVNSGIALALPTFMIKNFKNWKRKKYDNKAIAYYTIVSIILFIVVILIYLIDLKYSRILGYYGKEMLPLIFLIYTSIYILGLYYFYANYLFYYKKAGIISKTTFKAAILNVILTIIFIYIIGVMGAAIATFISYIYYLYTIRYEALKIDSTINIKLFGNIIFFFISSLIIYYLGASFE